ncbi:MAG: TetR family transcriptional regulator [Haloplasmataceae bacterium]|nr:TetR family transcriptional regulator [Haloplasmataceae bacterium]
MYTKFLQLNVEKQNRIINASLKVFSESNYKDASTDDIVKEADISKGALFYYFKNKKILYEFIFDYVVKYLTNEVLNTVDLNELDLLIRLKQILLYKLSILNKYPDMIQFVLRINHENSDEIGFDILSKSKEINEKVYGILFNNIDTSKFRDDINIELAINSIIWSSEGYSNIHLKEMKYKKIDNSYIISLIDQFNRYLDLFKTCFYKGEN